ncbi:MAG: MFS transporter [Streptosporangiaceae bacterium]
MTTAVDLPGALDRTASSQASPPRQAWIGFAVVLAAMIMNLLDSTIVNVAAPSIQRDLGMSSSALVWIAAAYTLAIAVGLMTGGRLGDMFGRKRMLMIGLTGFVVASAGCALAWSPGSLIAGRVVQGLSAAMLTPQAFGLIRDLFPPAQMTKAFAALGPVIGLSTVAGPIVAGLLLKANLFGSDWRALFLINLPLGVFALIVGGRVLPARLAEHGRVRLDFVGTVLLAAAAFLLVFPLVDGRTLGWPAWIFGVLAAAIPLLGLFVAQQRYRVRSGRTPLVEFSVLRKRSYLSGVVFVLVFFSSIVGFSLTMGLFLQIGLGFTPIHASLLLAAMAAGAFIGSGVGAWAATAVGRPILHIGLAIMAAGTLVLYLSLHAVREMVGTFTLIPGLAVFGIGMGMIFVPLFSIIMGEIADREVGSASGLLESSQQLGASLGVALLATLFFSTLSAGGGAQHPAMAVPGSLLAAERTLLITLAMIVAAFALGWLLPRRPRQMH